jgi:Protein of unknown function (DUF551)/Restriction alleviation protein Lar
MELLRCPFCSSDDIQIKDMSEFNSPFMIGCKNCHVISGYHKTQNDAVNLWNTRPSQWISVSEKLPEIGKKIIVFNGSTHFCWLNNLDQFVCCYDNLEVININHWMPLPTPPTETK